MPLPSSCLNFFDSSPFPTLNFQAPLSGFSLRIPNTSNVFQWLPYIKLLFKINWSIYCFLNTSFTHLLPSRSCSSPSSCVLSRLYYLSWRCGVSATVSRKPFPTLSLSTDLYTLTSLWSTPFPVLLWQGSYGLHPLLYWLYLFSLPRPRIRSIVYFNPQKPELNSS